MSVSVPGLFHRAGALLLGVLVVGGFVLGVGGPARADTGHWSAKVATAASVATDDLNHANQAFADKARPLVGRGIAAALGSAGAAEAEAGRIATAKFGDSSYLEKHFAKRGTDFGAVASGQYEKMAARFLQSPLPGSNILQKVQTNGDIVRFNPNTQEFGILSKDGVIRTYYIPNPAENGVSNLDYFIQEGSK